MKEKKYIWSLVTVYMCYFTHGMQAIILSQNKEQFFTQWGYTDATAGAAAVSLAITATGFGKFLSVWIGGEISDKVGRKRMAVGGALLYIICFAGLLFTSSMPLACVFGFLAGVATSGFWDGALYPAVQEAVPKYSSSALVGVKFFVSISGVAYPLIAVHNISSGNWHINIWIPLVFSIICAVLAAVSPFVYDDMKKQSIGSGGSDSKIKNAAEAEIAEIKAKMNGSASKFVNFLTMFYGFVCMVIMYGGQQYTKAFGLTNRGLTELQAAGLTSIYTVGSITAVVFWAFMMGKLRWNPLKVLLIDSVFTAVALAIVLLVPNVGVVYVAIALLGFFAAGGALQTGLALRQLICPGPKGRNAGIYYTWMGFASTFLPYLVSAMTKAIGEQQAVYTMMGVLLGASILATVMMLYLLKPYKQLFGRSALGKDE